MKVLIIVPAYNEQDNIEKVVNNLIENYPQYDYLVVNDGSKDKTLSILKEYAEKDTRVKYLSFSRNFGKEAAMKPF